MHIHHFYPRTSNIGDHFVQHGIERMIRSIQPEAIFESFDVNSRGKDKLEYGLTHAAVERANRQADLVVVGGSNLYEGGYRWPWGVSLEAGAIEQLRVPLFLLGIGSGSNFASPLHQPSHRAEAEIKLLNDRAAFSGARDVTTFEWLRALGITKAKLLGDPATFIFNHSLQNNLDGHILITMPPRRFWTSKRQFVKVHLRGRRMFAALVGLTRSLLTDGYKVIVACNDPIDLPVAKSLFDGWLPGEVVCPKTPVEYFALLSASRALVNARLHTAVVAFSMGIPFVLVDVDQRTSGFVKTYQLEDWSVVPLLTGTEKRLKGVVAEMLSDRASAAWQILIERRNQMHVRAMDLLREAFRLISKTK